jgi:uncharacterized protein YcaQ
MRRLTPAQVRRAALGASGLLRPRPTGRVDVRHFRRVMADLDVVQLDSVNVVTRAHEMPFWSRLGGHDTEALRRWLWLSREVHECWAHVASLMPTAAEPLLRHRQREHSHPWPSIQRIAEDHPGYVDEVEAFVRAQGPVTVSDLEEAGRRSREFWGWNPGKKALHWLFLAGRTAVHERTPSFVAAYAGREDVLPDEVREHPGVPREEAVEQLLLRAVRAQAVGTAEDLADHHRLNIVEARAAVDRLVRRGALVPVDVRAWDRPAFTHPDLVVPRRGGARALVAPFDPIVWFRPRLERLFGFSYRIEIYVPAARREYGYYVFPFLLDDRFVARVDLKADRAAGCLRVRGAWAEDGVDRPRVARELAAELRDMATWLGTPDVVVDDRGDLAGARATAV